MPFAKRIKRLRSGSFWSLTDSVQITPWRGDRALPQRKLQTRAPRKGGKGQPPKWSLSWLGRNTDEWGSLPEICSTERISHTQVQIATPTRRLAEGNGQPAGLIFIPHPSQVWGQSGLARGRECRRSATVGALPCLLESVLDSLGVTRDHSQEYPRRAIRPRSALFPVLQLCRLETEPRGELRLAQPEAPP